MERILHLFVAALLLGAASGCSDGADRNNDVGEWDFVNPSVCFFVSDAATGENLLDPSLENSILNQPISVTYEGKKYEMVTDTEMDRTAGLQTRATWLRPLALRLEAKDPWGNIKGYHLAFGEFNPCKNLCNQTFTLDWGDGMKTEVAFDLYIVWRKGKPDIKSPISIDGKEHGSGYYNGWIIKLSR